MFELNSGFSWRNTVENKSNGWKTAVLTGGLMTIIALPLSMGANAALDSGVFTVKAQDSKDPTIVAFAGIDPRVSDPDSGNPDPGGSDPGGDVDPDGNDNESGQARTFSCGDESIVITKAMQDFSDSNKTLKDAGKASEMVAYPDGGWKTIEENPLGMKGVAFTNGETLSSFNPITNSAGWGLFLDMSEDPTSMPGDCRMMKMENGLPPAIESLTAVSVEYGSLIEEYTENGDLAVRADGKPAAIEYLGSTRDSGVLYEGWNTDKVSGSAWRMLERRFNSDGTVKSLKVTNNTTIFTASDYEGDKRTVPQDVWDNFWNGGY